MKKTLSILLCVAAVVLSPLLVAEDSLVPDALTANPQTMRLKHENERVRVLEARIEPGQKENVHSHPAYVVYVVAGGALRLYGADGKSTELTVETGEVMYREPVAQHWGENVGTSAIHLILVELKQAD